MILQGKSDWKYNTHQVSGFVFSSADLKNTFHLHPQLHFLEVVLRTLSAWNVWWVLHKWKKFPEILLLNYQELKKNDTCLGFQNDLVKQSEFSVLMRWVRHSLPSLSSPILSLSSKSVRFCTFVHGDGNHSVRISPLWEGRLLFKKFNF